MMYAWIRKIFGMDFPKPSFDLMNTYFHNEHGMLPSHNHDINFWK